MGIFDDDILDVESESLDIVQEQEKRLYSNWIEYIKTLPKIYSKNEWKRTQIHNFEEDIDDIDLGDLGDFNEPTSDSKNESLELDDDMLLSDAEIESLKKLSYDDTKKDIGECKNTEPAVKPAVKSSMLEELKNVQVVEPKHVEVANKENNPDLSEVCAMSAASYDDEF